MSDPTVTLSIDGVRVSVPKGTLIVDAAKLAGIEIPVFCYHPKLKPVGMCRMCLVEVGQPERDRQSGEALRGADGQPVIRFSPKLETACTTPVGEGWVVRVSSDKAREGRKQILEYLLTSHPLDCPICDKGGECPLQNLTLEHGPGKSRFLVDEKQHLGKSIPLGELIYLDQERCIQCARCTRFQESVVGDAVIGLAQRGRRLQIVTFSEPGFDSYFSGDTTDICPVGALTTADFRFGARPWELRASASICPHCPVGCNLALNMRREDLSGGREVVKRVLPRQNEAVNEIWICDKGRFAHHYAGSPQRLAVPLVRRGAELVAATWDEALDHAAQGLRMAGPAVLGIAGGRASNEDLFRFRTLIEGIGGRAVLDDPMAGGDVVQRAGVGLGTDLGRLGAGDLILVIATDLHEEAPIWWLRVKQAADRGARLIVANGRPTRLDTVSSQVLRYAFGEATRVAYDLFAATSGWGDLRGPVKDKAVRETARAIAEANNVVIFFGREGLDFEGTAELAESCAALLAATGHLGRPDNGLIGVWPRSNTQGAWDMGIRPDPDGLPTALEAASAIHIMAADPAGDNPQSKVVLQAAKFLVVQELFLTETAKLADVVLPARSFIEREGTFTSGERRVQRFFTGVRALGESRPDYEILAQLGGRLGVRMREGASAQVFEAIAASVADYAGLSYAELSRTAPEWPPVGQDDLYFGGAAQKNGQGLGVQLAPAVESGESVRQSPVEPHERGERRSILLVPVARLYDHGTTVRPSAVLAPRLAERRLEINPAEASRIGLRERGKVEIRWDGRVESVEAVTSADVPEGVALLPRSLGIALDAPVQVELKVVA